VSMAVVVVLDTLRYDRSRPIRRVLHDYGFEVEQAFAPANWTLPSHVSMLTGLYPSFHHVHRGSWRRPPRIGLLDGNMGLVTANPLVDKDLGYNFAFQHRTLRYFYIREWKLRLPPVVQGALRRLHLWSFPERLFAFLTSFPTEKGVSRAIRVIRGLARKHFPHHLLVNLMEVHEPYVSADDLDHYNVRIMSGDIDSFSWIIGYRDQVRYLAERLPDLLEVLFAYDDTIYFVSDHGQLLGDHGLWGHMVSLYPELLFVPFAYDPDTIQDKVGMGIFSLTKLPQLVRKGVIYLSNVAYAESFGLGNFSAPEDVRQRVSRYDSHLVAVYYKGRVSCYDVDRGVWHYGGGEREMEAIQSFLHQKPVKLP